MHLKKPFVFVWNEAGENIKMQCNDCIESTLVSLNSPVNVKYHVRPQATFTGDYGALIQ